MPSTTVLKWIVFVAAAFMLLPLPVMQYVGEESFYAINAIGMQAHQDYWHQYVYGSAYPKLSIFLWPVIAICNLTDWQYVDMALRFTSVSASWGSAAIAGLMARHLFLQHINASWLAAAVYLSMGEVAFWYGWLGYADATFAFFIFSAIASLWMALEREHLGWFSASLLLISLAFLAKNISAYALYGLAGLVLMHRLHRWHLLKKPSFLLLGLSALIVPWLYQTFAGASDNAPMAIRDAMRNFTGASILDYLWHWISFPAIFIFRALPISLLLLWLWIREKQQFTGNTTIMTLSWVLLVCFAPFWLSASGTPRYLIPLYGWAALLLTGLLLQLDRRKLQTAIKIIMVAVAVKLPYSFLALPYIKDWRPERDIKVVAEEIMHLTQDAPLHTEHDMATGLSIAAYINVQRPERGIIRWYRGQKNAYTITEIPAIDRGKLIRSYRLRGDGVYLYKTPK